MSATIQFVFDEEKAAHAAAWVLRGHGESMDAEQLLAVLYLADRQAFIETGYPITGDDFVATSRGPTLKRLSTLLRNRPRTAPSPWSGFVSHTGDSRLSSLADCNTDSLSENDRRRLSLVLKQHRDRNCEQLAQFTRELPEWSPPAAGFAPVDTVAILRAAGFTDDEIDEVVQQAASTRWLHDTLNR